MTSNSKNFSASYINARWVGHDSINVIEISNPADCHQVIGRVAFADSTLAKKAVEAAHTAWPQWRNTSVQTRFELVDVLLNVIQKHREQIARIITLENGKTLTESLNEVDASLNEARFQLNYVAKHLVEKVGDYEVRHEPLGVALLITPWNFPLATVLRKMVPALMAGNTVVLKPSELTPLTAIEIFRILDSLDVPEGVANLVLGEGQVVGEALVNHPTIRVISFTGSTATGLQIARSLGARDVRFQAEMGGANTLVVLADADLETAAVAAITNGFACCGQWCTGTDRIIVEAPVYSEFLEMLVSQVRQIVVGNGLDPQTTMGPLISRERLQKMEKIVAQAVQEGARVVIGGKRLTGKVFQQGHFFAPTILADVTRDMATGQEEIFGPIVVVICARDIDDALELTNATPYGLSFSIYTSNAEKAAQFLHRVEAGLCHVNLPTAFRSPALPLLGWKNSGRGWPESGRWALDFFTRTKAIYKKT